MQAHFWRCCWALRCAQFATAAVERRATEKRAIALVEAAGALERTTALEFDEITPQRLDAIRLSPKIESILGEAKLNWTIEITTSQPPAKHVRAELAWQNQVPSAPVRLNAWVYQRPTKPPGKSP